MQRVSSGGKAHEIVRKEVVESGRNAAEDRLDQLQVLLVSDLLPHQTKVVRRPEGA
jgi:hypothetical protein